MQQRFHVAWLGKDFTEAAEVKRIFQTEYPDLNFQIRRRKEDNFELVKRLPANEAKKESEKNAVTSDLNKSIRKKRRHHRTKIS